MSEANRELGLKLKRVEDPESELVSRRRLGDPDTDRFALTLTDKNGNSVTYIGTRKEVRHDLIKLLNQSDRY